MLHSSLTDQYFDSSWQSVDRIPIVLSLLKEELNQLETVNSTGSPPHGTTPAKEIIPLSSPLPTLESNGFKPATNRVGCQHAILSANMGEISNPIVPVIFSCSLTSGRAKKVRADIQLCCFNK